jgi:DNA-binding response OmpR family regulator
MAKIMLCEDDEGIIDVTKIILEEAGHEVLVDPTGKNIVENVMKLMPDVILMDLWLPESHGDDVTRKLKSNEETKNIPVIILSANNQTEVIAREIGADDFICKPFDIVELEEKVKKYTS